MGIFGDILGGIGKVAGFLPIPGAGLVGAGLGALGGVFGGGGGNSGGQSYGNNPIFNAFNQSDNPNFRYGEQYTTQSDVNASDDLGAYEDIFRQFARDMGLREDELFKMFQDQLQGGGATLADAEEGTRGAISQRADYLYRPGGAVEQAEREGLGASVQSGFGSTGGIFDNARINARGRAGDELNQQSLQVLPQVFDIMSRADTARLGQTSGALANYSGLRGAGLENAFGARQTAAELPFGRNIQRQNFQFNEDARGDILAGLKPPSFLETLGETVGTIGGIRAGETIFDRFPGIFGPREEGDQQTTDNSPYVPRQTIPQLSGSGPQGGSLEGTSGRRRLYGGFHGPQPIRTRYSGFGGGGP